MQSTRSLPKRTPNHMLETQARGVLLKVLPPRWLCREVLERDYGIDFYLEMVGPSGLLTGHLVAVQLKGRERLVWRGKTRRDATDWFHLPGISTTTIRYWMALPLPVFLIVAELSTSKIFFVPVRRQVRYNWGRLRSRQTSGFRVLRICDLGHPLGQDLLLKEYYRERGHDHFMERVRDLVGHWREYQGLLESASQVSDVEVVAPAAWTTAACMAQTCVTIVDHLAGAHEKEKIGVQLGALPKVDVFDGHAPSGAVFRQMLGILGPAFDRAALLVRSRIGKSEATYWREHDPALHALCGRLSVGSTS